MASPNVFSVIFEKSLTFRLPAPWSDLPVSKDYRLLPEDRSGLLAELRVEFSDDVLLGSGAVMRGAGGDLALAPPLQQTRSPILAVYHSRESRVVVGLIVELRYFGPPSRYGEHLVSVVARQDQRMDINNPQIILATEPTDAVIFASLGLVTLPTPPLSALSPPELRHVLDLQHFRMGSLVTLTQLKRRQRLSFWELDRNETGQRCELIVPDFRAVEPTTVSTSSHDSLNFLRELHANFPRQHPSSFKVWRLTDATRNRLTWQFRHDLPEQYVQTIRQSLRTESHQVTDLGDQTPLGRLERALRKVNDLHNRAGSDREKLAAWRSVLALLGEARIAPLRSAAAKLPSAIEREQLLILADLAEGAIPLLYVETARLRQELEERILTGVRRVVNNDPNAITAAKQSMEFISKFLSLGQEIAKCRKRARRSARTPRSSFGFGNLRFRRGRPPQ